MPAARPPLTLALLVTLALGASAAVGAPGAPTGLRGFELRPTEPVRHVFSRTPAFAWNPVRSASCYEFRLATSRSFDDSSIVWSNVGKGKSAARSCAGPRRISISALSLDLTLPW
ncbi:MAG: hypothetical protein RMM28_08645, partial [Thermoleophilia bacterium]|nr:hypothetical protein [Thermoleophilia bacterium]